MNIRKILLISRPRFWLYTLGPYLLGISVVDAQRLLSIDIWYGFFYFLLPANVLIYGVNDYFDNLQDIQNPKKHKQEAYMRPQEARFYLLVISISFLLSLPLLIMGSSAGIVALIFLFFGIFYSCPPLRFKTRPFLDSLSNFFYILPGVFGYILVTDSLPPGDIVVAGMLWAISMHLFSAIVDIKADTKSGIKTSATVLGYKKSLIFVSLLWFFSLVIVLPYSALLLAGVIYPILPLYLLRTKADIAKIYWVFPWINAAIGFLLFWIIIYGK